ncbi:hypothetical protein V6615_05500 [Oscillospiraceae bacterium PP1C4]
MLKECGFYHGVSGCFRIVTGQKKVINLALSEVCTCTPTHISFSGYVTDGCQGEPLECVLVTIKCGQLEWTVRTDACGSFEIDLPYHVHTVEIWLYKLGYMKRYIGVYPIKLGCKNHFCL